MIRSIRPAAIDAAVVVVAFAGAAWPASGSPAWWSIGLALLASVPLVWRTRRTMTVLAVVGVATVVLALTGVPPIVPFGGLVVVYTVAAIGTRRQRWATAAVTAAGIVVSVVVPHEDLVVFRYLGIAYVAAYALGTSARARDAQLAAMRERARRLDEERAAAAMRERSRIARDLHDIITHSVGIMIVQAEAGPVTLPAHPEKATATFDAIADTGRSALVQLRRALGALRADEPTGRHPAPGIAAIPPLVEQTRAAGATVELTEDGPRRPLAPDVDVAAYRIVQESLTNAVRHGGPGPIRVRLGWTAAGLALEITSEDGGATSEDGSGYGLVGMRERARSCGGTLRAGARPGGGFAVAATLPVE
ncbi:sensor histidine kinase [Actinomycetes bacterium KLBMP 9759]